MIKYLWRMDAKPWEKIIERVESAKEKRPSSLKDVHKRFLHKISGLVRKREMAALNKKDW